mmetsp:Transcript_26744/g.87729  ORF Transcript_26744/g.87729 Transcript_26744/m.87729 type:complete len:226 (-) Transcript_26744:209-886(-)
MPGEREEKGVTRGGGLDEPRDCSQDILARRHKIGVAAVVREHHHRLWPVREAEVREQAAERLHVVDAPAQRRSGTSVVASDQERAASLLWQPRKLMRRGRRRLLPEQTIDGGLDGASARGESRRGRRLRDVREHISHRSHRRQSGDAKRWRVRRQRRRRRHCCRSRRSRVPHDGVRMQNGDVQQEVALSGRRYCVPRLAALPDAQAAHVELDRAHRILPEEIPVE